MSSWMARFKQGRSKKIFFGFVLLTVVIAAVSLCGLSKNFSGLSASGPWSFQDEPRDLSLLYFGYTRCPDLCPMALSYVSSAFAKLTPEELKRVRMIFVDLDAEHDTAQVAANYARQFHPSFVGVTGTKNQIDQMVHAMGARYTLDRDRLSPSQYTISHTNRIFFLAKDGRIRESLANPDSTDAIVNMIRKNL